jgi:2',3'-cyclic-nucleotide 2'-phosphodiesterase/3'-nucleotidase
MSQTKTVSLQFVETSDVHGCFFPYNFVTGKPMDGSMVRIHHYVEQARQKLGRNVLLLDNGDILQGQPICYWSNYVMTNEQNIAAKVVNYMKYDAQTIGNHDVETGHSVYDKWVNEVNCPVLGANVIDKNTNLPYLKPYTMFMRDGVKIAVIGLLTPTIPCWLNEKQYAGLTFENMVVSAKKWVKHVKDVEHADLVIGLFHSGKEGGLVLDNNEEDASARVAREVPGFDIIFYGHDHTIHNDWIINAAGQRVLTLDPSNNALNVAVAHVKMTYENGQLKQKNINGNIVSVRKEPIDEAMTSYFASDIERIKSYVNRRIGRFENSISTRDGFFGNSAFIDFIHTLQLQLTGADISFNAPLALDSKIEAGDITVADMFKLYRYENQLYVLNMTGREIKGHLEESYDRWVNTMKGPDDHLLLLSEQSKGDQQRLGFKNLTFNFDSAAGIDYIVDVTKPDGQKVQILKMSNGEPFNEGKTYKVVMNSYRGNGGGDLITKGAGIPQDQLNKRIIYQSPLDLRHYLMQEIERQGTMTPQAGHNWKFIPEEWTIPAAKRDYKQIFKE